MEKPVKDLEETNGTEKEAPSNFIKNMITEDIQTGRLQNKVSTRFPPEPNGYLHIGHAKAICINFGLAEEFKGTCNLRFDDTNPVKEDTEYVDAIQKDIKWLGFGWDDRLYYASDYFQKLYDYAIELIKKGKAYVDSLSAEQIREYRGTLTTPGKESPYRDRSVEENLDLFERMKKGEFKDGEHVLRAKIDMASPNINMRDPAIYRIRHFHHHRTGDEWSIYPMYDYAHGISDAIEGITHSLCSLEFEDHRPLYDWFLVELGLKTENKYPQQTEFARLNITHVLTSKRKLLSLVKEGYVSGWDDPRMPTLSGFRRRGYTPEAIRFFCDQVGVAKRNSVVDYAFLEYCLREDLNKRAKRAMAVLKPLKVVITNYPEGQTEELEAENVPDSPEAGTRKVPFSREIYIEQDDFMEVPAKKFHRLYPGNEIRLKHAYYVKCTDVIKDGQGNILEVHCTYDPDSRGGWTNDGRKVKGTSHWVSIQHARKAEIRLYDHLFLNPAPENVEEGKELKDTINPDSLQVLSDCYVEPSLAEAKPGENFQFLRQGYFCADMVDSRPGHLVFNRSVSLKDSFKVK